MKADEIIKAVAARHKLQPHDIIGVARFGHFVAARHEAIIELSQAGFGISQISRALDRDRQTIRYHLNPNFMAERKARKAAAEPTGALKYLPEHIQAIVVEYAKAENTTPRAIVSEWIAERAQHEMRAKEAA